MNVKNRGSYLSEKKGNVLSVLLQNRFGKFVGDCCACSSKHLKIFAQRQRLQIETSELFAKEGSGRQISRPAQS